MRGEGWISPWVRQMKVGFRELVNQTDVVRKNPLTSKGSCSLKEFMDNRKEGFIQGRRSSKFLLEGKRGVGTPSALRISRRGMIRQGLHQRGAGPPV